MKNGYYRIKTWKEMEDEFGLDKEEGFIKCENEFVGTMEEELPEDRIIEIKQGRWKVWSMSLDMTAEYLGIKYPKNKITKFPKIDKTTWFYINCKRNRRVNAQICQCCPFRKGIEEQEIRNLK